MNTVWSKYVQGVATLYYSRKLRFDDLFRDRFRELFRLDDKKPLKILEIGCGPGALAGALRRWYPRAEITAIDRDSDFIAFAREHEEGIDFIEGDATALPFDSSTFDVTISNTVSEHVEPSRFYGEQLRVLKPGGVCLVLSSRKGIRVTAPCIAELSEFERNFFEKAEKYDDSLEKYQVCQYPMSESELPAAMERGGFEGVSTGYVVADMCPDDPKYSTKLALDMINAERHSVLDGIDSVLRTMPAHFTAEETAEMKRLTNAKFDTRTQQYLRGAKQWDTGVSVILTVRGEKRRE